MSGTKAAGKAVVSAVDDGESIGAMEPMKLGSDAKGRDVLVDLVTDLVQASRRFRAQIPESIAGPLADIVGTMNCYYSNLIEGHHTHPVDIERAIGGRLRTQRYGVGPTRKSRP